MSFNGDSYFQNMAWHIIVEMLGMKSQSLDHEMNLVVKKI